MFIVFIRFSFLCPQERLKTPPLHLFPWKSYLLFSFSPYAADFWSLFWVLAFLNFQLHGLHLLLSASLIPVSVSDTALLDCWRLQPGSILDLSGSHVQSIPSVTPILLSNGSEIHMFFTHCDHSYPDDYNRLLINLSASSFALLRSIYHDANTIIFLICKYTHIIGVKPISGLLLSFG